MSGTALFAGSTGPLADALTERARSAGEQVVVADPSIAETHSDSKAIRIPWNSRSALSARSLVIAAVNECGSLDRATIVISPQRGALSLVDTGITELERYLDNELRSVVYLVREMLSAFSERGQGELTVIIVEPNADSVAPLQSLVLGAVDAFLSTILEQYRESGPPVYGFAGPDSEEHIGEFADFVRGERLERGGKIRGRIQRFGKRGAFRSFFR